MLELYFHTAFYGQTLEEINASVYFFRVRSADVEVPLGRKLPRGTSGLEHLRHSSKTVTHFKKEKDTLKGCLFFLVRMTGLEPAQPRDH